MQILSALPSCPCSLERLAVLFHHQPDGRFVAGHAGHVGATLFSVLSLLASNASANASKSLQSSTLVWRTLEATAGESWPSAPGDVYLNLHDRGAWLPAASWIHVEPALVHHSYHHHHHQQQRADPVVHALDSDRDGARALQPAILHAGGNQRLLDRISDHLPYLFDKPPPVSARFRSASETNRTRARFVAAVHIEGNAIFLPEVFTAYQQLILPAETACVAWLIAVDQSTARHQRYLQAQLVAWLSRLAQRRYTHHHLHQLGSRCPLPQIVACRAAAACTLLLLEQALVAVPDSTHVFVSNSRALWQRHSLAQLFHHRKAAVAGALQVGWNDGPSNAWLTAVGDGADGCFDRWSECAAWRADGASCSSEPWFRRQCPVACGVCSRRSETAFEIRLPASLDHHQLLVERPKKHKQQLQESGQALVHAAVAAHGMLWQRSAAAVALRAATQGILGPAIAQQVAQQLVAQRSNLLLRRRQERQGHQPMTAPGAADNGWGQNQDPDCSPSLSLRERTAFGINASHPSPDSQPVSSSSSNLVLARLLQTDLELRAHRLLRLPMFFETLAALAVRRAGYHVYVDTSATLGTIVTAVLAPQYREAERIYPKHRWQEEGAAMALERVLLRPQAELFFFSANRDLWSGRYLHPAYRRDAPLQLAGPGCWDIFTLPLLSAEGCRAFVHEAEAFGRWSGATHSDARLSSGFENVPTDDVHLWQLGLRTMWVELLRKIVAPLVEREWEGYRLRGLFTHDFIARYTVGGQRYLQPHSDASTFTINVALNPPEEYEGGGTYFLRQKCKLVSGRSDEGSVLGKRGLIWVARLVSLQVNRELGVALIHPGRLTHRHSGLQLTNGTRYILVSFVDSDQ